MIKEKFSYFHWLMPSTFQHEFHLPGTQERSALTAASKASPSVFGTFHVSAYVWKAEMVGLLSKYFLKN
jgi:hypothetical protein